MPHSSTYNHIHSRIIPNKAAHQKNISFTQYSMYKQCPHHWWLHYGKGLYPFGSSIDTVFGTAMHETIQEWLRLMYEKSVKASEEFKMATYLYDRLVFNYKKEIEANNGGHFSTPDQLNEYYEDGCAILKYLKAKRKVLFDSKNIELIGIELPLYTSIFDDNDIFVFNAKLDLTFYDKVNDTIEIPDLKTSGKGWAKYQKSDQTKMDQALLYKHFFSKQMNIPLEKIESKFIILKRKVWEEAEWPQPRTQTHIPAQGERTVRKAVESLEAFIKDCYNMDGTVRVKEYAKDPTQCKFCPFAGTDLCDQRKS